jgi:hypothetical protein
MNATLSNDQLIDLRNRGLIESAEIAFIAGDLLIAENPVTSEKRVVGAARLLTESSNRRILKG